MVNPTRIVDTRAASRTGACPSTSSQCLTVPAGGTRTVQLTGRNGVPSTGVSSVVVNLTATNTTSNGYLVAYAADSTKPNTTNLSFAANSTVATLAQVKVSADGRIKIYAHAQADIVIDLEAWISAPTPDSQSYTPLDQVRIADTRYGTGVCSPSCGRMGAYSTRSLELAGHGGVPTTGVSAVVVNITATATSASGWLKAYASGDPTPDGTSVVYEAGKDVANLAILAVGSDGRIALSNSAALDVIIDVVGYYGETTDTWTYAYSPDGIRATKTGPQTNTTYKWDRASGLSMLLSETTASVATTYYIYGPGGLPIEQINANGSVYFIHHDQLGSTRMITDVSGNAVATISYDAYGNERARSATASSPFGFAGQYSDAESGFQYLRARYYDPTTGQFLTRDPIEALTRSAYGYVYGNPLNATDPSGLWCITGVKGHDENGDEICNGVKDVANNVYHPIRAVGTAQASAVGMAMNVGAGADCRWNSKEWVTVCYGGRTILGAQASTIGGVINTKLNETDFASANGGRLLAHEVKHTDQWAIFGPLFAVYDAGAAAVDWGVSKATGCDQGTHNIFEIWAGLKDGGYK